MYTILKNVHNSVYLLYTIFQKMYTTLYIQRTQFFDVDIMFFINY